MEACIYNVYAEKFNCNCNANENKVQRKCSACKDIPKTLTTSDKQVHDEGRKFKRKSSIQNLTPIRDIKGKLLRCKKTN